MIFFLILDIGNKPPGESHIQHDLCLNALRKVSTTLTDLHIDFKLTPAPPTFIEIRATCPNLVKLGYHASYFKWNQAELNSTGTIDRSKLVELDIGTNKAAMSILEMNALLQQYPDIKKLSITSSLTNIFSTLFLTIHQNSNRLRLTEIRMIITKMTVFQIRYLP